jgi:hypothetical protein
MKIKEKFTRKQMFWKTFSSLIDGKGARKRIGCYFHAFGVIRKLVKK